MAPNDHPNLGRLAAGDRYDLSDFSAALDFDEQTGEILSIQLILPAAL